MSTENLEQKIRKMTIWFSFLFIFYLAIAFIFLGKYPYYIYDFNYEKAYEILKDSLTLLAAFLAPVAAFILFSDWRVNHRLVNNEADVLGILKDLETSLEQIRTESTNFLSNSHFGFYDGALKNYDNWTSKNLNNLGQLNSRVLFSRKSFKNTDFHDKCIELISKQNKLVIQIILLVQTYTDIKTCEADPAQEATIPGLMLQKLRAHEKFSDLMMDYSLNFEADKNAINSLASEHRI
ncbi:hypothetical protein [Acinetobacter dispersus]|uniref:Uncharacterized protein n=1 Tax=Acinetobacter dispersus TaxID=70348 RepID=N9MHJ3_9GAMM|nr:hypothetical protein [Acinetobacter dispersus]ENW92755.1 hypothetical protein F904_02698 [Acinetobacter dispersus]